MRFYKAKGLHIQTSTIHGYGVFTDTKINEGDIIEVLPVVQKMTIKHQRYCCTLLTHSAFPYLNMLNHSEEPNADWSIDYVKDIATFIAVQDIDKGKEIYINYNKESI